MTSHILLVVNPTLNFVDIKETASKVLFLKFSNSDAVQSTSERITAKAYYFISYFSARKKNL